MALVPGRHDVHASMPGFHGKSKQIEVRSGQEAHVSLELEEKPVEDDPKELIGWIAAGSGAALVIAGAGLLIGADGLAGDVNATNADPAKLGSATYDQYVRTTRQDVDSHGTMQTTGYILLGVGAAAAVTGTVLLLWPEDEPSTFTTIGVAPLRDGAAVFGAVEF